MRDVRASPDFDEEDPDIAYLQGFHCTGRPCECASIVRRVAAGLPTQTTDVALAQGFCRDGRYWARTSDPQLVEPAPALTRLDDR